MPAIEFMASTPVMSGDLSSKIGGGIGDLLGTTKTKFSVDPAQAQKLIQGLEDARGELEVLYQDAMRITGVDSPGKDIYSGFATLAIRKAAGTEPGGYIWANIEARKALDETIKSIQDALNVYKETEINNQAVF